MLARYKESIELGGRSASGAFLPTVDAHREYATPAEFAEHLFHDLSAAIEKVWRARASHRARRVVEYGTPHLAPGPRTRFRDSATRFRKAIPRSRIAIPQRDSATRFRNATSTGGILYACDARAMLIACDRRSDWSECAIVAREQLWTALEHARAV